MKKNNNRKIINKHIGNNFNANSLAYKAIQLQGSITKDSMTYNYNKFINLLSVSDGITVDYYEPLITTNDIDPFNRLLNQVEVKEMLNEYDYLTNHWLFTGGNNE